MKKGLLVLILISTTSLVACGEDAPTTVDYEGFYQEVLKIEEHYYSEATLTIWYYSDITSEGKTDKQDVKQVQKYSWDSQKKKFVPVEEYDAEHGNELSKTVKAKYENKPEEPKDSKDLGFQYFIKPFKTYVDITEKIETRTIRTIESYTYDKYGYMTNYLLSAEADGTYKDQPISGIQKTTFSVSYK